jgi:SpoVK/Ycf46/Vps4 family AAA+-type ATPase
VNDRERDLIRYVCYDNMRMARIAARTALNGITAKKDESFKKNMLEELDKAEKESNVLPYNLQHLLVRCEPEDFPHERFLLREQEAEVVDKALKLRRASEKLSAMGISYLPALIFHGKPGCGKTMLAKYLAHKANLPFLYANFSNLVESYLGNTQKNLSRIFEYAKGIPCVLCLDEIDAIGMARGQRDDVGEMNRIVIALMQELDRLPNDIILVATTNRFDRLDPALISRFPLQNKLEPLSRGEILLVACKFFESSGIPCSDWIEAWCAKTFSDTTPTRTVIQRCTEEIVNHILETEEEQRNE